MKNELRFYAKHIRAADVCMSGARSYFANRDWDWDDFLDHGRPLADLEAQTDEYAKQVVAVVKEEES